MRGVEAALCVLKEVEKGAFASESLRRISESMSPEERTLASTLVYAVIRRQGLWRHLIGRYCRRSVHEISPMALNALVVGTAGILELRHFRQGVLVNALLQALKASKAAPEVGLVNAVLHAVAEKAPSYLETLSKSASLRDQALVHGIPGWVASWWGREWGQSEAKQLIKLASMKAFLALRLSPGEDRDHWIDSYREKGGRSWPSPLLPYAVRLASSAYPPSLPGFKEGLITPQTESSMFVGEALREIWSGERLLDMCGGRGIKAGQIAQLFPEAQIEFWELSLGRFKAAQAEMKRLGVFDRFRFSCGDALALEPHELPSAILLDVPCTGSGTWARHPEAKWRLFPSDVGKYALLQEKLLERAVTLLPPGGVLVYSTCSLFREENELVVASVMSRRPELVEIPLRWKEPFFKKGRPWGTLIWPCLPWLDGFYLAVLEKRSREVAKK